MIADQDSDIALTESGNDALNIVHCNRIYASERLVQHHELGICDKRACYLETPALATRQRVSLALAQAFDAQFIEQSFKTFIPFRL